nr:F-box protein MET30 [Biomphalaria glabrata]
MNGIEFLVSHHTLVRKHLKGEVIPHLTASAFKRTKDEFSSRLSSLDVADSRTGRGQPSSSGVEFKRQMEHLSHCLRQWSHQQKCCFLEELLRHSSTVQIQFLYTVLQPSVHRDFMYTMRTRFPEIEFSPISTHITRHIKKRLREVKKLRSFYRVDSAYIQQDEEVARVKFPPLLHNNFFPPKKKYIGFDYFNHEAKKSRGHDPETDDSLSSNKMSSNFSSTLSLDRTPRNKKTDSMNDTNVSMSDTVTVSVLNLPTEAKELLNCYRHRWTDSKRNEFLEQLILSLDPRQIYFVSKYLSFKQQKDLVGLLPRKLALKILSHLSVRQLLIACKVSKRWHSLASSNTLWKAKCQEVTIHVPIPSKPNWKLVYRDNCHLRYNWNNARYQSLELVGHTQSVQCVTCYGDKVATGSADQTIIIWDIHTGVMEQTLTGHSKGVWCVQFFTKHLLLSGSFDTTIRMWNLRTGQTTRTFFGHKNQVLCIKLRGTLMVSGSQDKMAKLWDVGRTLLVHTLSGHSAAVFSVDMSEDCQVIVTAAGDKTVRLWDKNSGQPIKCVWVSPNNSIMTISYSQGYFVCAYDLTICLYKGSKVVRTFDEHRQRVESVKLIITDADNGEGYLVSAGQDGLIKYWSLTEDQSLQTLSGHQQAINSIFVDEVYLASASSDKTVRVWNFNVGIDYQS